MQVNIRIRTCVPWVGLSGRPNGHRPGQKIGLSAINTRRYAPQLTTAVSVSPRYVPPPTTVDAAECSALIGDRRTLRQRTLTELSALAQTPNNCVRLVDPGVRPLCAKAQQTRAGSP